MSNLTIKGIPDQLMESLRQLAKNQRRSLNSEVLFLLEHSVKASPLDPESYLSRIVNLHQRVDVPPLTEALLEVAINEGRA